LKHETQHFQGVGVNVGFRYRSTQPTIFLLPDSIQIATVIVSGCDAFLTNDVALRKVTQIRAIVVNKLEM
jgi:hypothetical protein